MELIWIFFVLLEATFTIVGNSKMVVKGTGKFDGNADLQKGHGIGSIRSEDGDIIDCMDIYKQPAFAHPTLKDHKIQLYPSNVQVDPTATAERNEMSMGRNRDKSPPIKQLWQKSGTCPKGTIPVLRIPNNNITQIPNYGRKNPMVFVMLMNANHSVAIVHAEGYAYYGAKGDMLVWNPQVELDDEYSISHVSLLSGNFDDLQTIESGWTVNPSVYGDRQTRLFTYWTGDGGKETGCFDLTCPGFVQTSNEIALGAAIYPISNPTGLPSQISIYIYNDRKSGNWWVEYGENKSIGYWPKNLFPRLKYHFTSVKWGGDVYSSRVGTHPHTATAMGSGRMPNPAFGGPGSITRMRVLGNNYVLRIPEWFFSYTDEYRCYEAEYIHDYVVEPEFNYGGPGRSVWCP